MTFKDLAKQTYRECEAGVTYNQVVKIMVTMLRVALEEFVMHPATATVDFVSLFKFYLKQVRVPYDKDACPIKGKYSKSDRDSRVIWILKMEVHDNLKKVIRGDRDPRTLSMGAIRLYPDADVKASPDRKQIKFTTHCKSLFSTKDNTPELHKKRNVNILKRLPEEEDEEE